MMLFLGSNYCIYPLNHPAPVRKMIHGPRGRWRGAARIGKGMEEEEEHYHLLSKAPQYLSLRDRLLSKLYSPDRTDPCLALHIRAHKPWPDAKSGRLPESMTVSVTAMPIHLRIVYGCFTASKSELCSCQCPPHGLESLKYLLCGPLL